MFMLDDDEWQLVLLADIASDGHEAASAYPSALIDGDNGVVKANCTLLGVDNN